MKRFIILLVMALTACAVFAIDRNVLANDDVRQALYGALDSAAASMKMAPLGKGTIAVLPMQEGHSLLAGKVKDMLVKAGFSCVEGREDPMWDEILKEIEWDERKNDILDPATIVTFGKLKAAQILFQCQIRVVHLNEERVYAEIEMRATEIATKSIIWGDTFAYRHYIGKDVSGIIALDNDLRMLLKKNFASAKTSLTSPVIAGKLDKIKTVTVVPLCGDIDSYMTGLAIEMLSQTKLMPQSPQIPSLSQIRVTARDGLLKSDAVFYGSVRDLRMTEPEITASDKKITEEREVYADIQLFIEDPRNGNILWSNTVTMKEVVTSERDMTREEIQKYRKEKFDDIPGDIAEDVVDNWSRYLKIAGIIVAAVIGLIVIVKLAVYVIGCIISRNNIIR